MPRVAQSGGPDQPARHGSTAKRCNRVLKDWVAQSSQKIALYGPPELKDRMTRWKVNGQHAVFAGAKRYLRLLRCIVRNEVPYLSPAGRRAGASQQESAEACRETWKILVAKWRKIPDWREIALRQTSFGTAKGRRPVSTAVSRRVERAPSDRCSVGAIQKSASR